MILLSKAVAGFNNRFKGRYKVRIVNTVLRNYKNKQILTTNIRFHVWSKQPKQLSEKQATALMDVFLKSLYDLGFVIYEKHIKQKHIKHIKIKDIEKIKHIEITKTGKNYKGYKNVILEIMLDITLKLLTTKAVEVFEALLKLPKARVVSYKELAEHCNTNPRVIGFYMSRNPYPVIIPCYKVVRANGSIGGYSEGIKKKIKLLRKDGVEVKNKKVDFQAFYRFNLLKP